LPDAINVDITPLKIGMSVRVSDLMTENLEILNAANAVVCSVKMSRGALADEEEGAAEGAEGEEGAEETAE
jgi:large subunit ribosomal protein L25